jgi:DNA polymerase
MASARFNVSYDSVTSEQRFVGKVIILGCGYGMGHKKFQATAASWGLNLSLAEAKEAVDAYRRKYSQVPKMWYGTYSAVVAAIRHPGKTFAAFKCKFRVLADHTGRTWLRLTLPNKNNIYYCEPRLSGGDFRPQVLYSGINGYTKKWDTQKRIIPGLLVENIIQATAREYMAEGAIALQKEGYKVIGLVHDEALNELPESICLDGTISEVLGEIMCYQRDWCPDLPMSADGYVSKNYKKD